MCVSHAIAEKYKNTAANNSSENKAEFCTVKPNSGIRTYWIFVF